MLKLCPIIYASVPMLYSNNFQIMPNYVLPVWGPSLLQRHVTRIQRLQNHAIYSSFNLLSTQIQPYYGILQSFTLVEVSSPYQL